METKELIAEAALVRIGGSGAENAMGTATTTMPEQLTDEADQWGKPASNGDDGLALGRVR